MGQRLKEIIAGDQSGFELRIGYYPQIKHGLMGFYPGIITDSDEIILVFEKDLIEPIWSMMDPRHSEWTAGLFFVNAEKGIACSMSSGRLEELLSLETWRVLSRSDFEQFTANGARPFSWAPGVLGTLVTPNAFERMREVELQKLFAA